MVVVGRGRKGEGGGWHLRFRQCGIINQRLFWYFLAHVHFFQFNTTTVFVFRPCVIRFVLRINLCFIVGHSTATWFFKFRFFFTLF
jgi:hypothetical protein